MKEGSVTVQTASPKVCFLAALGLQTSWERSGEAGKGGGGWDQSLAQTCGEVIGLVKGQALNQVVPGGFIFSSSYFALRSFFLLLRNTTRKKLVGKAIKDENVKLKQEDSPPASFKMFLYSPLRFASVGTSFLDKNNQVWGRCFFLSKWSTDHAKTSRFKPLQCGDNLPFGDGRLSMCFQF